MMDLARLFLIALLLLSNISYGGVLALYTVMPRNSILECFVVNATILIIFLDIPLIWIIYEAKEKVIDDG